MYYGCKKEVEDKRDYKAYVCSTKPDIFPEKYEITIPEVKDQGIVNSCVAHALASFLEEAYKDDKTQFSAGFIYGYRPLGYSQDQGMYPREALKTLLKVGDVPRDKFNHNKEMPEIKDLVNENFNSLKVLADVYRIYSYARIYTQKEIKNLLFNDIPVPISIPVYNNLKYDKNTFIVQKPCGMCEGYHMILLVGWNENGFILQNSWGKDWGNNGRAILPYDYPIDSAWAISTEENNVYTYTTLWQKIYSFLIKMINRFKIYFHI